jgi:hypothetical protein
MYSSEYTSGFSWPEALHLASPRSPRHEGNAGQAPSPRDIASWGLLVGDRRRKDHFLLPE